MKLFVLAAALGLLLAPSARGDSQVFVTSQERLTVLGDGHEIVGPHPAGDSVVWGERRGKTVYLRKLAADGRVSEIGSVVDRPRGLDNPYYMELTADDGQLAFRRVESTCAVGGDCRHFRVLGAEIRLGPLGGPYALVASGACREGRPDRNVFANVVLAGGVLSRIENCDEVRYVSRDLATRSEFAFVPPPPGTPWAGTGRYVAVFQSGEFPLPARADVVVYEVETGRELYRVANQPSYFALGEDGLLVALDAVSGELSWADRSEPFAHRIGYVTAPRNARLTVRRRLVAVVGSVAGSWSHTLLRLDGQRASQADADSLGRWGFDGRRLAWASWPCRVAIIRVWDPLDASPDVSGARCPAARPRAASSRVGQRGSVFVEASCPARPALGCAGTLRLTATASGSRSQRMLGETRYAIASGERERLEIDLRQRQRRFVRRHARVAATVLSTATERAGFDTRDSRRLRFTLVWRGR